VQHTEEGELDEEAEWIYQQAFCKSPVSKQPYFYTEKHRSGSQRGRPQSTVPKIKEALNFMRNHFFEVPFIANYRKEYVKPELDLHNLWKIWLWDEKVCGMCVCVCGLTRSFNVPPLYPLPPPVDATEISQAEYAPSL